MPMTNYPHGFANGVTIRGLPVNQSHTGQVFWVGNGTAFAPDAVGGANGNPGTFQKPMATIAYAISQCLANRGDLIMVKQGHAETVSTATALALSKAGVAILGCGSGSLRPSLTLDTAVGATIGVSAANVSISNFRIRANFADIVSAFTLAAAADFAIENCAFEAVATDMNFLHIVDTNATTNAARNLRVSNCTWIEPDAATLAAFLVDGTNDGWDISDNFVVTGAATANVAAMFTIATGKILTGLRCLRNQVQITGNSGSTAGIFLTTDGTTNTGILGYNNLKHLDATTELFLTANAGFGLFENRATAVASTQGYLLPAIDS